MFKCRCIFKYFTLLRLRISSAILFTLGLSLEVFMLALSFIVLKKYPSNTIFISLCVLSFFSSLSLLCSLLLTFLIQRSFKKPQKIFAIVLILALLSLASGNLYYAILISTIKSYLKEQVELCNESEVFSELYWGYKRLYSLCDKNIEECTCFIDKSCVTNQIVDYYYSLNCDGYCGNGENDCQHTLSSIITSSGILFTFLPAFAFVLLVFSVVSMILMIKYKLKESPKLDNIKRSFESVEEIAPNREISISLPHLEKSESMILADISEIQSPINHESRSIHQIRSPDLSAINNI